MKPLDRQKVRLIRRQVRDEDGFVDAAPGDRMAMAWEITRDT